MLSPAEYSQTVYDVLAPSLPEILDGLPELDDPQRAKLAAFRATFKPKKRGALLPHNDIVKATYNFIRSLIQEFGRYKLLIY